MSCLAVVMLLMFVGPAGAIKVSEKNAKPVDQDKAADKVPVLMQCQACDGKGTLKVLGWFRVRDRRCAECEGAGRVVTYVPVDELLPIRRLRGKLGGLAADLGALRRRFEPKPPRTIKITVDLDTADAEKRLDAFAAKAKTLAECSARADAAVARFKRKTLARKSAKRAKKKAKQKAKRKA